MTPVTMATKFETNTDYNSLSIRNIAEILARSRGFLESVYQIMT